MLKAARYNQTARIIGLLLEYGATSDVADEDGNTALHFAAIRGTAKVAKFLIDLGADPYRQNNAGNIPVEEVTKDDVIQCFQVCVMCKKFAPMLCNHCNVVRYCNIECQKKDWLGGHKKICAKFRKRNEKNAKN